MPEPLKEPPPSVLFVRAQRRAVPDRRRLPGGTGRRPRPRALCGPRARRTGQPAGGAGDGRGRHRPHRPYPAATDRAHRRGQRHRGDRQRRGCLRHPARTAALGLAGERCRGQDLDSVRVIRADVRVERFAAHLTSPAEPPATAVERRTPELPRQGASCRVRRGPVPPVTCGLQLFLARNPGPSGPGGIASSTTAPRSGAVSLRA